MYDATDDPYTYENSTVLVNKLDLRDQGELDDFEAEITGGRTHFPKATWILRTGLKHLGSEHVVRESFPFYNLTC
jgi:fido (protein-threonine AMPylation protein)